MIRADRDTDVEDLEERSMANYYYYLSIFVLHGVNLNNSLNVHR